MNSPAPVRNSLRAIVRRFGLGSYRFRLSIGALKRPHYAHIVYNAAQLAKKLGHSRISVLEYGVAGGQGLLALEEHAREAERIFSIGIDIYGFDTGEGLPQPQGYKDLPYHWKGGFYVMDQDKLVAHLRKAKLVLGDIRESATTFFDKYRPAPIGAIAHDLDFYSSTMAGLAMLDAGHQFYLPRIFCYFDDTVGSEVELFNDYTGERLAIADFNAASDRRKLCEPYYLVQRRPEFWHRQIWIGHFFDHPAYNTFISSDDQQAGI